MTYTIYCDQYSSRSSGVYGRIVAPMELYTRDSGATFSSAPFRAAINTLILVLLFFVLFSSARVIPTVVFGLPTPFY